MINPFKFDLSSYATYVQGTLPQKNIYKCQFKGSGILQPVIIEGVKICLYNPKAEWTGGKTKTYWKINFSIFKNKLFYCSIMFCK